jgi:hypothetical protein
MTTLTVSQLNTIKNELFEGYHLSACELVYIRELLGP